MAQQIRELQTQLEQLRNTPVAQPAAEVVSTSTAAVAEQYGEDFAKAVDAIAEERTKKLRDELSSTVEQLKTDTATSSRNVFMRELSSLVPNWQAIDQDTGFTAYLDEFDPLTGRTRREFFNEADRTNDAARVAMFFAGYVRGKTPAQPARPAAPAATPPVVPSVEPLIVPDSSRASSAPEGRKIWTKAEVAKFYANARPGPGGKQYGIYTAEQYALIDQDISAAAAEGRLRG
jgi:hypothetical protein